MQSESGGDVNNEEEDHAKSNAADNASEEAPQQVQGPAIEGESAVEEPGAAQDQATEAGEVQANEAGEVQTNQAGEAQANEAGEEEASKPKSPEIRSKGQPRPAKVALLVWRIAGNFASRVCGNLQEHTPDFASWQNRKRRLTQETLLVRIVKQVVEWEQYAESALPWKEPFMQQREGKLEYVQGNWELRPGRVATVADATAAMIQALGIGGVRGEICDHVRKYIETFHKRLAIRGYSTMDAANVCLYRANLQREFFAQGSISRRFQVETKVLANELGKRRAENNKFDSYANTIALKEKFFRVQLRQSQLTAEANLASRSLYTFRQLAKLYRSVKDCIDEYMDNEDEITEGRPQTPGMNLFKKGTRLEDYKEGFFDPGSFTAGMREQFSNSKQKRVEYQQDNQRSSNLAGPRTGPRSGNSRSRESQDEQNIDADRFNSRASFTSNDTQLNIDDKEGHHQRIEDLQQRRDELKVAAATMVAKSRFNQLVKLMDQGHAKLHQLSAQTKHNDEIITGIKEAIEEEVLPVARKWVHDMARAGKLPRDMLEKVQTESLRQAGVAERDALLRKVGRMDEILEEMTVESRSEKMLRRELEDLGGQLPASAPELAAQALQEAKTKQEEVQAKKSRASLLGNKAKGYGLLQNQDEQHSEHPSRLSMMSANRQSMIKTDGPRQSVSTSRRTVAGKTQTDNASLTAVQKLEKVNNLMSDARSIHDELKNVWPTKSSVVGNRLLERAAALDDASKAVGYSLNKIVSTDSFETFEEQARRWKSAGDRLIQNMESFTDALEYEQMPDTIVQQAMREQEEQIKLGLRRSSGGPQKQPKKKLGAGTRRAKLLQKLQEALVKMDGQINSQMEKNGRQKHTNEELAKLVSEAERDLWKLGIQPPPELVKKLASLQEPASAGNSTDAREAASPPGSPRSKKGKQKKKQEGATTGAAGQEAASVGGSSAGVGAASGTAAAAGAAAGAAVSAAASGAPGTSAAGTGLTSGALAAQGAAGAEAARGVSPASSGDDKQDSRLRHVQNQLAVASLRRTDLSNTVAMLEKQLANVKAGRDPDYDVSQDSERGSGEIDESQTGVEGKSNAKGKQKDGTRKSRTAASENQGKQQRTRDSTASEEKSDHGKSGEDGSSTVKEKEEKARKFASVLERRGKNVPQGAEDEGAVIEGEAAEDGSGGPQPVSRRLAISGPSSQSRSQRAVQMGLTVHRQTKTKDDFPAGRGSRGHESRQSNPEGPQLGPGQYARGKSEKKEPENSELDELEPWRRIFPNDPPEVARQKYEFCRAHKVVYAHLYIHKKQRRLKFKLVRLVKQQRRHLKLKTKLLMSFLSDDQKIALQAEVGLQPDGHAKQEAHHKAELARLNDRLNMLGKLLAFWRRRMGAFEDEIEGKRKIFRGEIGRALEHVTRMADLLRIEREYEREVLQERHREIEERRLAEMEKAQKVAQEKAERQRQHGHHHHPMHGRSEHIAHPHGRHAHGDHDHQHGHSKDPHKQGQDRLAHSQSDKEFKTKDSTESKEAEHPEPTLSEHWTARGFHRRDESGPASSEAWNGHMRRSLARSSQVGDMAGHLEEAMIVHKTQLAPRSSNPRSSIGGAPVGGGKKSHRRATIPEEDKALEFLHTLMHRLAAVNEAVDSSMHVGETAMSDTLLAPKVNGQALLKYYIGLILQQPEKQREIVFNHLLGLERTRLIYLVRQSARHSVRTAIEACNEVIRVLEMKPADLEAYVHATDRDKEPTPSESEEEDSSSGLSSSCSSDDKQMKEEIKQRKQSKKKFGSELSSTSSRQSATASTNAGLGARQRGSALGNAPLGKKLTVNLSNKGALKKGSTVKHGSQVDHAAVGFELTGAGSQDHEEEERKPRVAKKFEARPIATHSRSSLTLGGPGEEMFIVGGAAAAKAAPRFSAQRSSIGRARTQPNLQDDSDAQSKEPAVRSALSKEKKPDRSRNKHITINLAAELSKDEVEDEEGTEGENASRKRKGIKFDGDKDGEDTGSSSGLSDEDETVGRRPDADSRQAGRSANRRRTGPPLGRRNSIGSERETRSQSMMQTPRRLSSDSIKAPTTQSPGVRKFADALLKRQGRRASTEFYVSDRNRRASFDTADLQRSKPRASTRAFTSIIGLDLELDKPVEPAAEAEEVKEPDSPHTAEIDAFGAAMGEEWAREAKAARRASLLGADNKAEGEEGEVRASHSRYRRAHLEMGKNELTKLAAYQSEEVDPAQLRRKWRKQKSKTVGSDLREAFGLGDRQKTGSSHDEQEQMSVAEFLQDIEKNRRDRGTPVPGDFSVAKAGVHFEDSEYDKRDSVRRKDGSSASPPDEMKIGHQVAEMLHLVEDPLASRKRRSTIIGEMEEAMQGVKTRFDSISATSHRGMSILQRARERASLANTEYEGSDGELEPEAEDEEYYQDNDGDESKGQSLMTVLIAAKMKRRFLSRRKSFRPQDINSILRERSKFLEASQKFNKWLKRRGNLENEIKKSLPPMDGRPRSALARLTHMHRGHRTRGVDNNVDFLAASFLARQLWHHRLSCLPSWTSELDAEWQAIKDAVRQTKHLRLNEQQKRVAEMLHEMDGTPDSQEGDDDGKAENIPKGHQSIVIRDRMSKMERTLAKQKSYAAPADAATEHVRKELARQMRKEIQKKTRTLSSEETSFKHEARLRKKRTLQSSRMTTEVGSSDHRAALFKLDEELFAMGDDLAQKEKEENERMERAMNAGWKVKREMKQLQKGSERKLRQRAVLGNVESGSQPGMVDVHEKRNLKNAPSAANQPRWTRWGTAKTKDRLEMPGFGNELETHDKNTRHKGKTQKKRDLVERKAKGETGKKKESEIVNRHRKKSVMFSKYDAEVREEEGSVSEKSEEYEPEGGDEGDGEERSDGASSSSDESSGESWDGLTQDEEDLLDSSPRRDRRPGFLMQSQYLERIQTSEMAMRPLLLDHGKHLERRLGVPLSVIIQTALVQDGECEAILLNMPAADFLSAMERMLLELEKRYLAEEEEAEERRASEHLIRAANRTPGLGYAPPVEETQRELVTTPKQKRASQRRSQHNHLSVGRRSRCNSRQKKKLDASRAAPQKGMMFRRMSTERFDSRAGSKENESIANYFTANRSLFHADAHSTTSESSAANSVVAAAQLKRQLQPPKQTLSATDFRLLAGRTDDWLAREAERRKRPEQERSAKPAQGWLLKRPPSPKQREQASQDQIEHMRGALHRNLERAFVRHVQLWKHWRMGIGVFASGSDISEGHESSEDQEVPIVMEDAAENQRYSEDASGDSEDWGETVSEKSQDLQEAKPRRLSIEAWTEPDARQTEASDAPTRRLINSDSGSSSPAGDVSPQLTAVEQPLAISGVGASDGHRRPSMDVGSPAHRGGPPRGTLRRLPSMPIRPAVAPEPLTGFFDVSDSKRTGQLPALEAQPLLPSRMASSENLHKSTPRSMGNAGAGTLPDAATGTLEARGSIGGTPRLARGAIGAIPNSDWSEVRPQTAAAPGSAPADPRPKAAPGELKPLQGVSSARGSRPAAVEHLQQGASTARGPRRPSTEEHSEQGATARGGRPSTVEHSQQGVSTAKGVRPSTVGSKSSTARYSPTKMRPVKEPVQMGLTGYLENFDECDLDVLLHDVSRPATRLSRPGTRMSSGGSRPGTRTEWERVFGGRVSRESREDVVPVSVEADAKLTGWQDFNWPSAPNSRKEIQLQKPSNFSDQTPNLPSLDSTTETPTSPAVQHSMVSSSVSTQDSWKADLLRDKPQWKAKELPKPPSTAPGGVSSNATAGGHQSGEQGSLRTPRLPETSTPRSAPGQSRSSMVAEKQKGETSARKETPPSSGHALAALCHGLERQAQRNSAGGRFSDDLSADMAAAAAYKSTVESPRGSGAWTRQSSRSSGSVRSRASLSKH